MRAYKILQIVFLIMCLASSKAIAQTNIPNKAVGKEDAGKKELSPIAQPTTSENKKNNSSLLYSDEEISKIEEAVNAFKNNTPFGTTQPTDILTAPKDNAKSYIYLGAILYKSPTDWSVWVNDQRISVEDNKIGNELYIKSISQDKATIVWTMSISKWKILANQRSDENAPINKNNQVEFNFTLSFNQTYMLVGNKIAEGRVSASSTPTIK